MNALELYARRIWTAGTLHLHPPMAGVSFGVGITRVVLHREGCFQAELIAFAPNIQVPMHRHPNVESLDMVVSGQFSVITDGGVKVRPAKPRRNGRSAWFGRFLPIPSHAFHGGLSGSEGACIVSFQEWRAGPPDHIVKDWHAAP